jgi:hypothetical protein
LEPQNSNNDQHKLAEHIMPQKMNDLSHLIMPRTASTSDHLDVRGGEEHTSKSCMEGGEEEILHGGRGRANPT